MLNKALQKEWGHVEGEKTGGKGRREGSTGEVRRIGNRSQGRIISYCLHCAFNAYVHGCSLKECINAYCVAG